MTVLAVTDETDATATAWGIWDRADALYPWTPDGYDDIARAVQDLKTSLELADDMAGLRWEWSPSTAGCAEAVARDIDEQAEAAVVVIGKHMGDEAAAFVRGENKGEPS